MKHSISNLASKRIFCLNTYLSFSFMRYCLLQSSLNVDNRLAYYQESHSLFIWNKTYWGIEKQGNILSELRQPFVTKVICPPDHRTLGRREGKDNEIFINRLYFIGCVSLRRLKINLRNSLIVSKVYTEYHSFCLFVNNWNFLILKMR